MHGSKLAACSKPSIRSVRPNREWSRSANLYDVVVLRTPSWGVRWLTMIRGMRALRISSAP